MLINDQRCNLQILYFQQTTATAYRDTIMEQIH